jgi:N-acetylneuraminic acid mutarotase
MTIPQLKAKNWKQPFSLAKGLALKWLILALIWFDSDQIRSFAKFEQEVIPVNERLDCIVEDFKGSENLKKRSRAVLDFHTTILDESDPKSFEIDVLEIDENTIIGSIELTDKSKKVKSFSIVGGDEYGYFTIDNAGTLSIADHHAQIGSYPLLIQATDEKGWQGKATIKVEIKSITTNQVPILIGQIFNITPNFTSQRFIAQIEAEDPDAHNDESVSYLLHHIEINKNKQKILGDEQSIFELSKDGKLKLKDASQIKLGDNYLLHIKAIDAQGGMTEAKYDLNVLSTSAPMINSQTFSIVEGSPTNTLVGTVVATDSDGSIVNYEITAAQFLINPPMPASNSSSDTQYNPMNIFSINATNGQLRVNNPKYLLNVLGPIQLTVRVRDNDGLTATANVTVNVLDMTVSIAQNYSLSWATAAAHPNGHNEATGGVTGDKLYVLGGFTSTFAPKKVVHVYNPNTNTWTKLADMPPLSVSTTHGGATHMGFASDGTDFYIAAGYAANASGTGQVFGSTRVYKYTVATDTYQELPQLPINRAAGELEYIDGKLYYFGGTNTARTTDQGNLYMLNLATNASSWTQLAMMPNPRNHLGSAVYHGKIYVFGGQKEHDGKLVPQDDVHMYDPATNTWTHVTDMPRAFNHIHASVFTYGEYIFTVGGQINHNAGTYRDVYAYHPTTNTWIRFTDIPAGRMSPVAGVIDGKMYVSGGNNSKTTYVANLPSQFVVNPPPIQYTLQLSAENGGTVNNIGGSYPAGTSLTAQATPNQGFTFDKWVNGSGQTVSTNNPYTFTLNTNTTLRAVFIQNPSPTNLHIRINAGGNQVTTSGQTWAASQGFANFLNRNTTSNISGTSNAVLYQTFCISNANLATLLFAYPNLPTGTYRVRLHFVENYWGVQVAGGTGRRVFSVNVEGSTPTNLQNIDFSAIAPPLTAIVRETTVNVSDGTLNMSFIPSADRPSVAAIEIIQQDATTHPPQYTLQLSAENGGTVNNIGGSYPAGTSLTAQATPNQGFTFDKWVNGSGQTVSTNNPYTFALNANTTLRAVFRALLHIRINAAGSQVTTSGQTWVASQGFANFLNRNTTSNISGTSDAILYQTFCISNANLATLLFAYPNLPAGTYRVRLHFVENYWGVQVAGGTGKRVFSVNVEGNTPTNLQNIDFNAIAPPLTAIVRETTVNVSDGTLNMSFIPSIDRPSVAAIEIIQEPSSTARVEENSVVWKESITAPLISPEIKVYPNPFNEQFTIEFQDFISEKARIRLYNSLGQTVEEKEMEVGISGKYEIAIPKLSEGVYFLEVQTEKFAKVLRIVKH